MSEILTPFAPPAVAETVEVELSRIEIEAVRGLTLRENALKSDLQAFQEAKTELLAELINRIGCLPGSDLRVNFDKGVAVVTSPTPKAHDA
ncbi:MAG: hypothetical protein ACRDV9_06005 [Acidimicrobiia bacterium]